MVGVEIQGPKCLLLGAEVSFASGRSLFSRGAEVSWRGAEVSFPKMAEASNRGRSGRAEVYKILLEGATEKHKKKKKQWE